MLQTWRTKTLHKYLANRRYKTLVPVKETIFIEQTFFEQIFPNLVVYMVFTLKVNIPQQLLLNKLVFFRGTIKVMTKWTFCDQMILFLVFNTVFRHEKSRDLVTQGREKKFRLRKICGQNTGKFCYWTPL